MKEKPTAKTKNQFEQDKSFLADNDLENTPEQNSNFEEDLQEDSFIKQSEVNDGIDDLEVLKVQVSELKKTAEEDRDRLLRVLAEFENYKKRMNRQMEDYRKYANEALLKDLLTVVDNLERAICSSADTIDNPKESCVVEGVEMTLNEILKVLDKYKVTPIEAHGNPFDPVFHEAVMQQESDDFPENTVINVLQKGYMIHDRLLRPSMVVVSKGNQGVK